jgi:hypothetical protein
MLRRNFKLSADMIFYEVGEELAILVKKEIVEAHSGADKHFLYTWDGSYFAQEVQIIAVANLQVRTRVR